MSDLDAQIREVVRKLGGGAIPMPDHPIRQARWYQIFVRLARPALDWIGNIGAAYALFLGHWIGRPMDAAYALIALSFVGALYGIRTIEKAKGVA